MLIFDFFKDDGVGISDVDSDANEVEMESLEEGEYFKKNPKIIKLYGSKGGLCFRRSSEYKCG